MKFLNDFDEIKSLTKKTGTSRRLWDKTICSDFACHLI